MFFYKEVYVFFNCEGVTVQRERNPAPKVRTCLESEPPLQKSKKGAQKKRSPAPKREVAAQKK